MSTTAAWAVAVLVGLAVWWSRPPRPRSCVGSPPDGTTTATAAGAPAPGRVLRPLGALGCGLAAVTFVGGAAGPVAGLVVAVVVWRVLGRLEPPGAARRREQLERDLPVAVDLLAACLGAGAAPGPALVTVGRAVGGPVRDELAAVAHRLDLGADPVSVWTAVARDPALGPLGRAMERAQDSGASVGDAVAQLALDLRDDARTRVEERARTLEVKVAAPLGLCLLPAFVVLGIVPMVAGIVGALGVR